MSNEALFVLSALIDILFILVAARRGTTWLYGTIILNLVLVTIFGAKLITVFGLATNAGNVFYACVFLATHFILERHGRQEGVKTVLFGVGLMVLFTLMAQLATAFSESVPGDVAVMSFPLRITFASILAYVFAQRINIAVYDWLKRRTHGKLLWLRSNGANIVGQLADSLLFFSIAFLDLPGSVLVQAILAGWLLKSLVVLAGTPFLYLDTYLARKKV